MKLVPVQSSMMVAMGYDSAAKELEVQFQDGAVWRYSDVLPEVYSELLAAESKGRFMDQNVIGVYPEFKLRQRRRPR